MKRVWIVSAMVALILCAGGAALLHLSIITKDLDNELVALTQAIERQDTDLAAQAGEFEENWEKRETTMMRYIHHDELDQITGIVARLKALAEYQDYSELAAETARLRHLIRHIYESELPTWSSII